MKQLKMKMAVQNAVNRIMAEEEAKIDRTIHKIAKMDEDDLEELRAKRLEDLKRKQMQRSKWCVASLCFCGRNGIPFLSLNVFWECSGNTDSSVYFECVPGSFLECCSLCVLTVF